ncbi:unannotated protein [freshwater metagenome]|uniref:Unannotated protein n=1 Tax=freshwater metagenome TaxID=449393 RepID=A0A6J7PN89_9ZZZZ
MWWVTARVLPIHPPSLMMFMHHVVTPRIQTSIKILTLRLILLGLVVVTSSCFTIKVISSSLLEHKAFDSGCIQMMVPMSQSGVLISQVGLNGHVITPTRIE